MRPRDFRHILGLLVLFGAAGYGGIASVSAECTVRAWVRALDLAPNVIVQGDARVKLSAGCPAVGTVSLGLRLKERSFVKVLRSLEDRERMNSARLSPPDIQEASPWNFPSSPFVNRSEELVFQQILTDKNLWIVREEERAIFETTHAIEVVAGASGDRDIAQDFAILVPSTNFPPALDFRRFTYMMNAYPELVSVESKYEYFVRVPFANGTTVDISAGLTSFQPLYDPADPARTQPSSDSVAFEPMRNGSPDTSYTAQINASSGLIFSEGSEGQIITLVISRTGPARAFTSPLTIRGCVEPTLSSKWAVQYNLTILNFIQPFDRLLRDTPEALPGGGMPGMWFERPSCIGPGGDGVSIMMPNSTSDEIQGNIVTTTSVTVDIPIKVGQGHIINFETYYQTAANNLVITLEAPRMASELADPDEPLSSSPFGFPLNSGPRFEDGEVEWVPWENKPMQFPRSKSWSWYTARIPAVVRPNKEVTLSQKCLVSVVANMLGQVVLSDLRDCQSPSLTHYLDQGAHGPIFVDHSAVHALLTKNSEERDGHTPILEPVVSSPPEGEELVFRYYPLPNGRRPLIYVGETWAKKVAKKGRN